MRMGKRVIAGTMIVLAGIGIRAIAQQAPSNSGQSPTAERLFEPYNMLTDLTPDQKIKIEAIHKTELEQEAELKAKEKTDILALLSDDQKKELDAAIAKREADSKARQLNRRADEAEQRAAALRDKASSATQPGGGN
jgi:hypothetical protein